MKRTKKEYEEWLNELEIPEHDMKMHGGRIPDNANYGSWLRRNDPIAFEVGFDEWEMEEDYLRDQTRSKKYY